MKTSDKISFYFEVKHEINTVQEDASSELVWKIQKWVSATVKLILRFLGQY